MDAIQLLIQDHKKVLGLLAELDATTVRAIQKRSELLALLDEAWAGHTSIEEEIFYPAFRDAGRESGDAKLYFQALEAHRASADLLLPDLLKASPASEQFGGRAKVVRDVIAQHIGDEERTIFRRAAELMDALQLRALGERMAERQRELIRLGHYGKLGRLARSGSVLMESLATIVTPESALPVGQLGLETDSDEEAARQLSPAARSPGPAQSQPRTPRHR